MVLNLRRLLYQSVELRTQGDAPIGVYLSGGLDSAIIAGILADIVKSGKTENTKLNNTEAPLTCFGVGFQEDTEYDEMRMLFHPAFRCLCVAPITMHL